MISALDPRMPGCIEFITSGVNAENILELLRCRQLPGHGCLHHISSESVRHFPRAKGSRRQRGLADVDLCLESLACTPIIDMNHKPRPMAPDEQSCRHVIISGSPTWPHRLHVRILEFGVTSTVGRNADRSHEGMS